MMETASPVDDAGLVKAAQKGDAGAFESLVRKYDEGVLRLAMNLLRSDEDARDVYQETFLKAYRSLARFRFESSFHTWLYRIATNLCLDHLRKRKRRREQPDTLATEDGELRRLESVPEQRVEGDPQRRILSGEIGARIEETLDGLTPRERMVFELRHYQGLRLRPIGEMLGVSEEAAKTLLFRATQKMRAGLGDLV